MARLAQLLLADGRFPAGAYAHSGGLEAAGIGPGEVPAFMAARLEAVAAPECTLALAAARADGLAELLVLDAEADARTPSPPLRAASRRLGSQLLRTAAVVWPGEPLVEAYREQSRSTPRVVAFGLVASLAGLDDTAIAQTFLYDDAAMVAAAAVRLLPVDAATTTRWLAELEPLIDRLAAEAVIAEAPLPAPFAPRLDLLSLDHAAREGKLFAS
jgi:urease accessory protein